MSESLLSRQEAARILGVSPRTLQKWANEKPGYVPHVKMGKLVKYERAQIERFIEQHRVIAASEVR